VDHWREKRTEAEYLRREIAKDDKAGNSTRTASSIFRRMRQRRLDEQERQFAETGQRLSGHHPM
jgi:hypothetical protein